MASIVGPSIVTNGLVLDLDINNTKSYIGSGSAWNDLITNTTFNSGDYSWANNITAITIIVFLEKTGVSTGYASHTVNKWNGGTVGQIGFDWQHGISTISIT